MVKVSIIGFGCLGRKFLRVLLDKGATVVAVFNRSSHVGQNAGEVIGLSNVNLVVNPVDKAEEILAANTPDVCLINVKDFLIEEEPLYLICANLGINVISLCGEAFFPYFEESEVARRLDEIFKKSGCSLTGSGINDGFWSQSLVNLTGSAHNLKEIHLECSLGMEAYVSHALDRAHHILVGKLGFGLSQEEYDTRIGGMHQEGTSLSGMTGNVPRWLCAAFNWTLNSGQLTIKPILSNKEVYIKELNKSIPAGHVVGYKEILFCETINNIKIKMKLELSYGEQSYMRWLLKAEPDIDVTLKPCLDADYTVAAAINRIPDVIRAKPGLITTNQMPPLRYVESLK